MKLGFFFHCNLHDIPIRTLTHDDLMHLASHRNHIIQCLFHELILVIYNNGKQYNFIVIAIDCIKTASDFARVFECLYCTFIVISVCMYSFTIM